VCISDDEVPAVVRGKIALLVRVRAMATMIVAIHNYPACRCRPGEARISIGVLAESVQYLQCVGRWAIRVPDLQLNCMVISRA
jgi:hypothetical protein